MYAHSKVRKIHVGPRGNNKVQIIFGRGCPRSKVYLALTEENHGSRPHSLNQQRVAIISVSKPAESFSANRNKIAKWRTSFVICRKIYIHYQSKREGGGRTDWIPFVFLHAAERFRSLKKAWIVRNTLLFLRQMSHVHRMRRHLNVFSHAAVLYTTTHWFFFSHGFMKKTVSLRIKFVYTIKYATKIMYLIFVSCTRTLTIAFCSHVRSQQILFYLLRPIAQINHYRPTVKRHIT